MIRDTNPCLIDNSCGNRNTFQNGTAHFYIYRLSLHFLGGSAGREGAALQLGGSIGNQLGRLFRFDEKDRRIVVMCGMSAAFSAIFGTPIAASIFSMEVVSVGVMYYAALVHAYSRHSLHQNLQHIWA